MTIVLILCLSVVLYLYIKERNKAKSYLQFKTGYEKSVKTNAELELRLQTLAPYLHIIDAEAAVKEAHGQADALVASANAEAKEIKDKSRDLLAEAKEKSDLILKDANANAAILVSNAESEAKRIAGKAYEAMEKADDLAKTAQAMKNIIEGYDDQYIIPTYSLLDGLADKYMHTDAGRELKRAREKTRGMIKNKTAAMCDYVEEYRKNTAIDFVIDAFMGKVDTILASVKEDNFGTLEQKIKDSFYTVNHNGKAFRDARITDLFLAARQDELKWACLVQALKEKEREEQRKIREQIREEEKAARDYEKALKEAQKEEELLNKAMDKVRKEMESASEAKKAQYEAKLKELEFKWQEAEAKNKRALSMAQQTKTGHVYIISNVGSFGEHTLKIGMTRRLDPMDRIYELGDASVPFDFDVHALILSEDAPALEFELHKKFGEHRINKVNHRKEFFKVAIHDLKTTIDEMGIQAQWTLLAEAREYRETMAMLSSQNVG